MDEAKQDMEAGQALEGRGSLSIGAVLAALLLLFGTQQILLWRFLDFAPLLLYLLGALLLAGAIFFTVRFAVPPGAPRIPLATVAICAVLSLVLCLLGGEGRFFYANLDWQLRNSQLFDMIRYDWPHLYASDAGNLIHRAQIGMFTIPALVGKALGQRAGEVGMLLQNSVMFTLVLSLASALFTTARGRAIALIVIVIFSGMDFIGQEIKVWFNPLNARRDHLEWWAGPIYSSHIAQIFWAPHHSITGWLGASLYLLWRSGHVRLGGLFVVIPLFPLWSPLAVMGLLPFLAHAGLETLFRRKLAWSDVAAPALTALLGLPALIYLGSGAAALNHYFFPTPPANYVLFLAIEVLPYIAAALLLAYRSRFGGITLLLAAACLLLIPSYQIGDNGDFQMRASIPAMFILAIVTADVLMLASARSALPFARLIGAGVAVVLALGTITGWREVRRAIVLQPSPRVACSIPNAWDQLEIGLAPGQIRLYLTPVTNLPAWMQASDYAVMPVVPQRCWGRPWQVRR